ncbi:hypothetical protein ES703_81891 [subsurface metagenome]
MARVTYGESITEYAGSIGGVTFLRNASGPIAKLRSNPPVNPSPDQSTYQVNMAIIVAYWPTLSQANKDLWDALAAAHDHTTPWGDTKTLSGYQWFISVNLHRLSYGYSLRDTPGTWLALTPPNSFTLVATATYLRAEWSPAYDPARTLKFYLTLPLRQSSLKLRRSLFYVGYRDAGVPLDYYDLTSFFESLAGVTWATFYASADCSIICRMMEGDRSYGYFSAFTSAIVKID